MIKGIGIDIVEIDRIQEKLERNEKLKLRILTVNERKIFEDLSERRKLEFLAGRFAAKEAFSKANGTGIGRDLSFQDIEIETDARGKPTIVKPICHGVHLSITHSENYAVAQVIIEEI
ncbi:holo-ACP synthase [Caldibacillus lycopersici]|uniref:Holo-[acyl-carrier-protein] synthase n=1 Tax=Perspicuibacillus lycopersici TaxID=1325689 RepID=A0AAE3LRX6_9BACI|nr:holo-ACP synthase [Perspicuibacillus lycopersici]MCU9615159.1 holo-ACP synthase [Perspicuibacillus lycopersici]